MKPPATPRMKPSDEVGNPAWLGILHPWFPPLAMLPGGDMFLQQEQDAL